MKNIRKSAGWIIGGVFALLVILAGIYSFEFIEMFVSNFLTNIGIVNESMQKATVIVIVFSILLFSKGFRKAIKRIVFNR